MINNNNYESNPQIIRQILELCEAFSMPEEIKEVVKSKCWKLTKNKFENENEKEYSNGLDKNTNR